MNRSQQTCEGRFYVLDGVDGAGKSTQASRLVAALEQRGRLVEHVRDPGGTAFSEAIRAVLLAKNLPRSPRAEAVGFFAARAQLLEEKILPALAGGRDVVCERWVSSTYAYQSAASGMDAGFVETLEGLVVTRFPDRILILDLPVELSVVRMKSEMDGIESRGREYMEAVRQGFARYAERHANASILDARWTVDAVHRDILRSLQM
jgi:dTMP kinase